MCPSREPPVNIMPDLKRYPLIGYLFSVLLVAAGILVTVLLWPGMRETPFVLLFFVVLLSSWRGGYGPGLVATALSALVSKLFLIAPLYSLSFASREDFLRLLVFVFNSMLFVWLFSTRKAAEEALRQSEENLRELFENANDLIYTHDLEGNYTSLNKAGECITGYTRAEAVQMKITDMLNPEQLARAREMIGRKTELGGTTVYELDIIAKDGHQVSLELSTRLIYNSAGQPVSVQGIGRDITERKRAERERDAERELPDALFEHLPVGVLLRDAQGRYTRANRRAAQIFEIEREQLIGMTPAKLIQRAQITQTNGQP